MPCSKPGASHMPAFETCHGVISLSLMTQRDSSIERIHLEISAVRLSDNATGWCRIHWTTALLFHLWKANRKRVAQVSWFNPGCCWRHRAADIGSSACIGTASFKPEESRVLEFQHIEPLLWFCDEKSWHCIIPEDRVPASICSLG